MDLFQEMSLLLKKVKSYNKKDPWASNIKDADKITTAMFALYENVEEKSLLVSFYHMRVYKHTVSHCVMLAA